MAKQQQELLIDYNFETLKWEAYVNGELVFTDGCTSSDVFIDKLVARGIYCREEEEKEMTEAQKIFQRVLAEIQREELLKQVSMDYNFEKLRWEAYIDGELVFADECNSSDEFIDKLVLELSFK